MAWVKIDDLYSDHYKTKEVGPLGEAMQVNGLCHANRYGTGGFIKAAVAKTLVDLSGIAIIDDTNEPGDERVSGFRATWQYVVDILVEAGVWEEAEGGWMIHDYDIYQQQHARKDPAEVSASRAEAGRKGGQRKAHNANASKTLAIASVDSSNDVANDVANASNGSSKVLAHSSPVPDPVPDPILNVNSIGARPRTPPAHAGADADTREDAAGMDAARERATWDEFRLAYPKAPPRDLAARWPLYCPDEATFAAIMQGLAYWKRCRQWCKDGNDYVTKTETWLRDKMYLTHPAPWSAQQEQADEKHQGRAGGDAAARPTVYALGDNADPYWAENHGLLSEVRKRKRDLAAGLPVPDDGRTGVGGTMPALPGRRVAQA